MEDIRQAIERAKAQSGQPNALIRARRHEAAPIRGDVGNRFTNVQLNLTHLKSHKIFAYDGQDPRSRPFDILRTELLRSMDLQGWKVLGVTSPTPGCGKTFTAINLALSISRQSDVCLVDLDLRKPQVGSCLGLAGQEGLIDVIEGRADRDSVTVFASVGAGGIQVLPTAQSTHPSDLIASTAMKMFLQDLAGNGPRIIILDLPPLLTGHDVLSVLPQIDCILLVTAVGKSKISEIEECSKHLRATNLVRVVLNKASEPAQKYGYY